MNFALGRVRRRLHVGLPPVPRHPHRAPAYLLEAVAAPYAAYGVQRLLAAYDGPLMELRRADGTIRAFAAQPGGDYPDYDAIGEWAGGSALSVAKLQDQTGHDRHLAQDDPVLQPRYRLDVRHGQAVPILFDGYARTVTPEKPLRKRRLDAAGLSLDRANYSAFLTAASQTSYARSPFWNLQTQDGTTNRSTVEGAEGTINGQQHGPRAGVDTIGATIADFGRRYYAGGGSTGQNATLTTRMAERLVLGEALNVANNFSMYRLFGMAVYDRFLSQDAGDAIVASFDAANGVPASYDYRVVFDGDSIMEGTGSDHTLNMPGQLPLTRPAEVFNTGVHGQQMGDIHLQRGARFGHLATDRMPSIIFLQAGTNDIGSGAAAEAVYANRTAPLIAYLRDTLSFKVAVCTLQPRTRGPWTDTLENRRLDYNARVRANGAGADLVLDLAAHPVMGVRVAATDTALYCDGLHPTSLGYQHLAGATSGDFASPHSYYAALTTLLQRSELGPDYIP